jgi:hypothetical protein
MSLPRKTPLKPGKPLSRGSSLKQGSGLTRKTPMPRSAPRRAEPAGPGASLPKVEAKASSKRKNSPKDTGPSEKTRKLCARRDGNQCFICGVYLPDVAEYLGVSLHHRANRGMGGSKSANGPENLIYLCGTGVSRSEALEGKHATGCHGWVTDPPYDRGTPRDHPSRTNPALRTLARHMYAAGWIVERNSTTRPPRRIPVWMRDGWVLLREDGIAEPLYVMPPLRNPSKPGDLRPYRPANPDAPLIEDRAFVMGLVADVVDELLSIEQAAEWLDTARLATRMSTPMREDLLRSLAGKVQIINDLHTTAYAVEERPLDEVESLAEMDAIELRDILARP